MDDSHGSGLQRLLAEAPAAVWRTDEQLRFVEGYGRALADLGLHANELRGVKMIDYFRTVDPQFPALSAHDRALQGETVRFEQAWEGRVFEGIVRPLTDADGRVVGTVGTAIEITERKQQEEALRQARDELQQRIAEDFAGRDEILKQLKASEQLFRAVGETLPIPVVISRLSDGLMLYANERLGDLLGLPLDQIVGRKTPEFYDDATQRDRLLKQLAEQGMLQDYELAIRRRDGQRRWLSVSIKIIQYHDEHCMLTAILDMTERKQAQQLLLNERRLLKRMLDLHERDRQLIAYEVHDGVVQDMTGAMMHLDACMHDLKVSDSESSGNLTSAARLLRGSINEARRLIRGLRPPVLEEDGLIPALNSLIDEISGSSGLSIELHHDIQFTRLAPALEVSIYRIVQEGLNNVWQHSQSPKARVELTQHEERVRVIVQDWGVGFEPEKTKKRRYGLTGVRERARLLGGTATIESRPGAGAKIEVQLPLNDVLLPEADELDL